MAVSEFWGRFVQEQIKGGWKNEEEKNACRLFSSPRFFIFNTVVTFLSYRKRSSQILFQQEWMWTSSCCLCIMMNEQKEVEVRPSEAQWSSAEVLHGKGS